MNIYPAIDLLDGFCVRLKQGRFEEKTLYSRDPVMTSRSFEGVGAQFLHLVDLSGAKDPTHRQLDLIAQVIRSTRLKVQVGGGIRTLEEAAELLELGADRVVIGSAAISQPQMVRSLLREKGGDRVTVALDVRVNSSGVSHVAVHGWQAQSSLRVEDALLPFLDEGLTRVLCTDIDLDGMMTGPNFKLYAELSQKFPGVEFQASGGVSSLDDLMALSAAGLRSAIVGKAIYEGTIDLEEAILRC